MLAYHLFLVSHLLLVCSFFPAAAYRRRKGYDDLCPMNPGHPAAHTVDLVRSRSGDPVGVPDPGLMVGINALNQVILIMNRADIPTAVPLSTAAHCVLYTVLLALL